MFPAPCDTMIMIAGGWRICLIIESIMSALMNCIISVRCPSARQPPACPSHAPSCSYTAFASTFRRGSTHLKAACQPQLRQCGRSSRRGFVVRAVSTDDDDYKDEKFLQTVEQMNAAGPPPGMSQEQFEQAMEGMKKDPEVSTLSPHLRHVAAQR